jgi:NitT/TauT family transport system substrate-binding protein
VTRARRWLLAILIGLGVAVAGCGGSGGASLGSVGKPVHLVVGYQPYYTEAWSALVLRQTGLWKKYLPKGSTVDFQVGLQGSILVGQMLAGKQQVGYMGDMPAIVGVSKRPIRDLRIVANVGTSPDECGVFLVRRGAPSFSSQTQALQWMSGKKVAAAQGSCADRVAQTVFNHNDVKPKDYLNQSLDLVTSDFQSGTIDAASAWEPVASKLVDAGLAKRVGSGNVDGVDTAAFLVMSEQLIKQRPDVAKDWLKAELAAERYLADPANAPAITNMAVGQTKGYSLQEMRDALYRSWPAAQGGGADGMKLQLPFTIGSSSMSLIGSDTAFLFKIHSLPTSKLPDGAIDPSLAQTVLSQSGDKSPVGVVKATNQQ